MELELRRIAKKDTYTIGKLYIDGKYFCDTLEDKDRGLSQALSLEENKGRKVAGVTAIPTGRYLVRMDIVSPKYSKRAQYAFCEGKVPRLINVPAYQGVLIHIGNSSYDTDGCILVGKNTVVGRVLESTVTFKALYERMKEAKDDIYITVK